MAGNGKSTEWYDTFRKKARENILSCKVLGKKKYYNAWTNRAYYAMFQLATIKLHMEKERFDHKKGKGYTHTTIVKKIGGRIGHTPTGILYSTMFGFREIADYYTDRVIEERRYNQYCKTVKEALKRLWKAVDGKLEKGLFDDFCAEKDK